MFPLMTVKRPNRLHKIPLNLVQAVVRESRDRPNGRGDDSVEREEAFAGADRQEAA